MVDVYAAQLSRIGDFFYAPGRSCSVFILRRSIVGMKKSTPGTRGSTVNGRGVPKDVDEYLARVPEPARGTLKKLRGMIRSAAPSEATEVIGYRIPIVKYKGMLVGYAAFLNHCSFFPMSYAVIRKFKKELKGFPISKGTIRFPLNKPPGAALVRKLVRARVMEKDGK